MDAGKPKSLVDQIQNMSGVEDEGFKDFIQQILVETGTPNEITTLDELRAALTYYIQKELGEAADSSH